MGTEGRWCGDEITGCGQGEGIGVNAGDRVRMGVIICDGCDED